MKNLQESQQQKWSWKIATFTQIFILSIVTDMVVSKFSSNEFLVKYWENLDRSNSHGKALIWSWKVMEYQFQSFMGTPLIAAGTHGVLNCESLG